MKKLGVSLVAVLVGLPMMAHATISDISGTGAVTSNTNVATTSYVKGAYNAMANAVNTAIGQANNDIAAKQAQLTAGGNNISATVKTTVGAATGEGAATDGSLVTEKAVRNALTAERDATKTITNTTIDADDNTIADLEVDNFKSGVVATTVRAAGENGADNDHLVTESAVRAAIDTAKSATTYTQGSGIDISNNEISASGITTSNIAANAGIVKTQLDSGVQTSLGKADTALQASNLDNVTIEKDATNGVQVKAGSIGTTQLASGVVTSLGKADTALQAADLASYGFDVWGDWTSANATGSVTVTNSNLTPNGNGGNE